MSPTKRQLQIVDFIALYIRETGIAPSIQEICNRFDLASTATVHKHLKNIEQRGLIVRHANKARAISVRGSVRLIQDAKVGDLVDIDTGEVIEAAL